jgi:hypothetical protein
MIRGRRDVQVLSVGSVIMVSIRRAQRLSKTSFHASSLQPNIPKTTKHTTAPPTNQHQHQHQNQHHEVLLCSLCCCSCFRQSFICDLGLIRCRLRCCRPSTHLFDLLGRLKRLDHQVRLGHSRPGGRLPAHRWIHGCCELEQCPGL